MKKILSDEEVESVFKNLIILSPIYQRMPKLGRAHLERSRTMEDNSILLTYLTPDRKTVIHNETTYDEMQEQGVTPLEALQTSIVVMDMLHGGKCPGAFIEYTFDSYSQTAHELAAEWRKRNK